MTSTSDTQYKKLDLSKIKFFDVPLKFEDVIKDAEPFDFDDDVLQGKRKIRVAKIEMIVKE